MDDEYEESSLDEEIQIVRRRSNISQCQKKAMFDFLSNNEELVNKKGISELTREDAKLKWIEMSEMLNSMPGSHKNWKDWRKTWHDLRSKNRAKNVQVYDEVEKNWVPVQTKKINRPRSKYICEEQKGIMRNFMSNNPRLIGGKFSADFKVEDARNKWLELTEILNGVPGGAKKSWKRWRKTWHDLSHRSKIKNVFITNTKPTKPVKRDLEAISSSVKLEDFDFTENCESFSVEVESPSLPEDPDPLYQPEETGQDYTKKNKEDTLVKLVEIMAQNNIVKEDYYKKKLDLYQRIANALETIANK